MAPIHLLLSVVSANAIGIPCSFHSSRVHSTHVSGTKDTFGLGRSDVEQDIMQQQHRRRGRWVEAGQLLESTAECRGRYDRRAHLARLVGIFKDEESSDELLIAVQPDRALGRKLIFLNASPGDDGAMIGHMTVETSGVKGEEASSILRGMLVNEASRGKGYSSLFLAVWLRLCSESGVNNPTTNRINKPLLALTLMKHGLTPLADKPGSKPSKCGLTVEVSVGSEGSVLLYSESSGERLKAGFRDGEVKIQRLVISENPSVPRGRSVRIRTQYEFAAGIAELKEATAMLRDGLHLGETMDTDDDDSEMMLTPEARSAVQRALYGRI